MSAAAPRTPCAVPFCRRSLKGRWIWWLCPEHKRGVPMRVKAQHRRAKAMCKRRGWVEQSKTSWWTTNDRARRVMDRAGRLMIRAAIKAATGAA